MKDCGFCGKKIKDYEKAYSIHLTVINPDAHPHFRENILWESDPYCSKECFNKSAEKIIGDLSSFLKEVEFAKNLLRNKGFDVKGLI